MRSMLFTTLVPWSSVNPRLPAGPAVMPRGWLLAVGMWNSVIWPLVVMRPILFALTLLSVNQRLPSGPAVMPKGLLSPVGMENSPVTTPAGVMRPMLFEPSSANQRLPSGPAVMPKGLELVGGMGNSVMKPAGVMRPILFPEYSVNQRLPSGPAVMPRGKVEAVGMGNSVMVPAAAQAGVVLRPSKPTETTMAVIRAVTRDRHPERFMFLAPLCMCVCRKTTYGERILTGPVS